VNSGLHNTFGVVVYCNECIACIECIELSVMSEFERIE